MSETRAMRSAYIITPITPMNTILTPLPITINKALFLCVLSAHSFSRHLFSLQYIIISHKSLRMTNAKENPRNNTKAG